MSTLEEQVEFLAQIAEDVARTLALPDLSDAQALRLYLVVEQGGSTFDRILAEMDEDDVEDDLFDAAADIADIWTSLSISTANKLRAMEGLAPREFPPDDGSSDK